MNLNSNTLSQLMIKLLCNFCCVAFCSITARAQYNLKLVVSNSAILHSTDAIYVAGNFNSWNPKAKTHRLEKKDGKLVLEIKDVKASLYEFKFTRGSWASVASSTTGGDLQNHLIVLTSDTTVYLDIAAWKDDFAPAEKKHTASANVTVIDTAFYMPQLGRNRRISIYLPAGYEKSTRRYPVIYLHDGQNLFDEFTAGFSEWGVDECLDSLVNKGKKPCIVVAIDNGPKRLTEYNPFYFERFGAGEGEAYLDFVVATLKPFIDFGYRTLPTKENTIIAGSSMGGLISYYAFLKFPMVFGKAGVFSAAFWTADSIYRLTDSLGGKTSGMVFFYMGALEGDTYLADMLKVTDKLGKVSKAYVYTTVDPQGRHNEQAWRKWFAEFYQWIVNDGNNYIVKPAD